MKEKKPKTESFDQWEAWAQQTYRTGGTQPPKNHGGIIAFLLALVIFLCGISTALGLMNIRLFRQLTTLSNEEASPVIFSQAKESAEDIFESPLGFHGQEVSPFWQNYHDLPQGIYVTEVFPGSNACKQGVLPGDVLIAINHVSVPDTVTLQQLLSACQVGDSVLATFIREDQTIDLTLVLE